MLDGCAARGVGASAPVATTPRRRRDPSADGGTGAAPGVGRCEAELDEMGSDVARITHLARVTYLLLHAVYADCMQSVHHAAVHAAVQWAGEKLSINLQHFIPLQSSADCSESLQIM